MTNNEFDPKKGEKSSLSDMINEYESDNALRDKIEAAKKRKAMEEEALRQAEIQRRLDVTRREKETNAINEPVSQQPVTPFMKADADATQVFSSETVKPLDDGDKTLVIMDNMKQRNFSSGTDTIDTSLNKKIIEPQIERLAPEFEVEGEKITEKDIEEYLPKDNKKAKKPSNPDKTNKIITYIIAGIASLCVIGLIVFALNFFGVFGGGSNNKDLKLDEITIDEKVNLEEIGANNFSIKDSEVATVTDATLIKLASAEALSTEDKTKVQVTTVDKSALKDTKGTYSVSFSTRKGTKVTVKATVTETKTEEKKNEKKEEPKKDNSAKISELEGQIKSYNDQIATLKAEVTSLQKIVDNKQNDLNAVDAKYKAQLDAAIAEEAAASTLLETARVTLEGINKEKDPEGYKKAEADFNTKSEEYKKKENALKSVQSSIKSEQDPIETKAGEAANSVSSKNTSIMELQNKIIDLQNQLNALK